MIRLHQVDTPIGPLVAAWSPAGIALLEFEDRFTEARNRKVLGKRFPLDEIVNEDDERAATLRAAFASYFDGDPRPLDRIPRDAGGTRFQRQHWDALCDIPPGSTLSYAAMAERLGRPGAARAVARANGQNPLSIIVPCHRLTASDGALTGYGGGLWRKAWLLRHEAAMQLKDVPAGEPHRVR